MAETTDIEKKSLEAHVELCAERYRHLELKLSTVESEVTEVKALTVETHELVNKMSEKRSDQIIGWGIGIIGFLAATVAWLLQQYVLK
jgi:hypothetical protein